MSSSVYLGPTVSGGGAPGGSDTQVQFNDAGVLGGDSGLTYNKTTDALTAAGGVVTAQVFATDIFQSGAASTINGPQTATNTQVFNVYDTNAAAYKPYLTTTAGDAPDVTFAPPTTGTLVMQATTYKSSDGSTGVTAGPFTVITSITVKNGLVTALTGS